MGKKTTSDTRHHRSASQQSLHYDIKLLFPVLFLVGVGIVMVRDGL